SILDRQMREKAQALADDTVDHVAGTVSGGIIAPLQKLAADDPTVASRLDMHLDQLTMNLNQWKQRFRGNSQWYETFSAKGAAIVNLIDPIESEVRAVRERIDAISAELRQDRTRLEGQQAAQVTRQDEIRKESEELEKQLQELLPAWLKGT